MATYKLVAEWNLPQGSIAQNVFYANVINGEVADQDDLITDLGNEILRILGPWLAQVATNVILALVRIYIFDALTGTATPVGTFVANTPGTGGAGMLPAGVAVKLGQYVQGRARPFGAYLCGLDNVGNPPDGLIGAPEAAAALATAAANTIVTTMGITGLAYRPRGYSRKDAAMVDFVGANNEIGNVFDYQRRRKAGSGV